MRISIKKLLAVPAVIAAGVFTMATAAYAQAPFQQPVGTVSSCNAAGTSLTTLADITSDVPYSGYGTFRTRGNSTSLPATTYLEAVEFYGTGSDPVFGTVEWKNDPSRAVELSTIRSNQVSSYFPATGRLVFHAQIRLSGSTETFYSETPVVMVNTNLKGWPHSGDLYQQEGVATFRSSSTGQTMQVNTMSATVTAAL